MPVRLFAQKIPKHFRHYKLVDMGTFGGPVSSINIPVFGGNLSNQGVTVGWSATSTPTSPTNNPLVCGGLDGVVPYITHAFQWNGAVTDLGAFPPNDTNCSEPFWVNAKGEIVGASESGEIDPLFGFNGARAVLWKDGEMTNLGSLGGNEVAAFGINNRGQIIGNSTNGIPDPYCFFGTVQNRAFLWEHGHMRDLGTLGGNCADSVGVINERGQIVGSSTTSSIANPITGFPPTNPFLWEEGKGMTDLGTLGGAFGAAVVVNNRGQVIGQSSVAVDPGACNGFPDNGDLNCHAFLWNRGTLIDLTTSTIGGTPEWLAGINDAGEIIGFGAFPNAPLEAFLWRKGVATDLGHLSGCFSFARTINSQGQVVGLAVSCDGSDVRAFLWENDSIVDLNTLIPPGSSLQLADAEGINDRAEIVGIGVPPGVPPGNWITQGHGFLLIPVCADGSEGCAEAPLDPAFVTRSRTLSGAESKKMTAEELAMLIKRMSRVAGRNRGFGLGVPRF
jgi:probable HAF family extracellular repeat protein